ncbi:KIF-binding protein-like [Mytilus galloprovincialis]|uniref:KIF-binding protein-like n=1 Tax=Mytilus galloprovincialis TaxID=29158 RepID=UPI003F7BABBC
MSKAWQDFLSSEGFERIDSATKLSDEDLNDDPEDDPYRSKYKAREIYLELQEKLKHLFEGDEENKDYHTINAVLNLKLAINYIDTEELATGEEKILKCIDDLETFKFENNVVNVYQHLLNNLGILWSARRDYNKALKFLKDAEQQYLHFKEECGSAPKSLQEYLEKPWDEDKIEHKRNLEFEKTYTLTLYYMAQVYAKLDEKELSAEYCQITLERQLEWNTYEPMEWGLCAATLSQYFISTDDYTLARHCLACAEFIYQEAIDKESPDASEEAKEKLQQGKADIERCWIKYGLGLIESSKNCLMYEDGAPSLKTSHEKFRKFNLEVTSREEQVTDQMVKDFTEARKVFLKIQQWINSAKEFYALDGRCSDYVEISQDHSTAYKYLAFFEMDLERQCKMNKRRADIISALINELNPQHYLLAVRQLMFEVAEIYSQMLDLKVAILQDEEVRPTPHALKKINLLAQQSILKYDAYLDTLKPMGKTEFPEEFASEDVRPALVASFSKGRLHSKFVTPDVKQRIANIQKSINCYKFVVDYCNKHPSIEALVPEELNICREMVALLPLKMEKIRQGAEI